MTHRAVVLHSPSVRHFSVRAPDPRATGISRPTRSRNRTASLTPGEALARVRTALEDAKDSSLAEGTKITNKSHWAYWQEFCNLLDVDVVDFGKLGENDIGPTMQRLRDEEETFAAFMAFVIACPRKGQSPNTANYAIQCLSTIRSHYALRNGRRPGLRQNNKTGGQLKAVIRGFQKTHPSTRESRMPILQQHLRAIKDKLNLLSNAYHKTLWALWLTQWQGVLRSSDLIKKAKDAAKPWDPNRDTHRGRLSVDRAVDMEGRVLGPRLNLRLKPNKTDQAGEKRTVKTCVVDEHPDALPAGQAIREMLRADLIDDGLERTPLFRHPVTHKEITYEESNAALSRLLRECGFTETVGTHSLRIGGATAYANASSGGYLVSGFMGLWASDRKDWYMHACSPRIDMAALEIGRAKEWAIAGRPGPVARYAS